MMLPDRVIGMRDMHPMQVEAILLLITDTLELAAQTGDDELLVRLEADCDELVKLFGGNGVKVNVENQFFNKKSFNKKPAPAVSEFKTAIGKQKMYLNFQTNVKFITENMSVFIEDVSDANSAFGVNELGEVVFFNSRIVSKMNIDIGHVVNADCVPNYEDKRDKVQWRCIKV